MPKSATNRARLRTLILVAVLLGAAVATRLLMTRGAAPVKRAGRIAPARELRRHADARPAGRLHGFGRRGAGGHPQRTVHHPRHRQPQ